MLFVYIGAAVLAFVVYLTGFLAATQRFLRDRMLEEICATCGRGKDQWHAHYDHDRWLVARGARGERNTYDVTESMKEATFWPAYAIGVCAISVGRATVRHISRRTPLTTPELERRISERAAAIDRMEEMIK